MRSINHCTVGEIDALLEMRMAHMVHHERQILHLAEPRRMIEDVGAGDVQARVPTEFARARHGAHHRFGRLVFLVVLADVETARPRTPSWLSDRVRCL